MSRIAHLTTPARRREKLPAVPPRGVLIRGERVYSEGEVCFVTAASPRRLPMDAGRFTALPPLLRAALAAAHPRRAALRLLGGIGLAALADQTEARKRKKHKKKRCAQAGQPTSKKRKRCCSGLDKDATGRCIRPSGGCTPGSCPPGQICLRSGMCQPCTVTCTGTPKQCGAALQAAMDGGGTVYACPGRYQGGFALGPPLANLSLIGAGAGDDPASNTILDGQDLAGVLDIGGGLGPVTLERVRFTDGFAAIGAGIRQTNGTLRMTECTVEGNTSSGLGGGIAVGGTLEMTRCTLRDNSALGSLGEGGGLYTIGTSTLTDCLVEDNYASDSGGGIAVFGGAAFLAGTTQVRDNVVDTGFGGGIYIQTSDLLTIAETCRVTENTAPAGNGGGIANSGAVTVTLQGSSGSTSPIVVDNCRENCTGLVPRCAATPVSCPS